MDNDEVVAFLYERVIPPYLKFVEVQSSKELGKAQDLSAGLSAASALYHFREYLPASLFMSVRNADRICPDYALARDVTNISKHGSLNDPNAQLRNPEAISEVIVITRYRDELGEYSDFVKRIELKLPDGSARDLLEVLTNVLNFWLLHLRDHQLSPIPENFSMPVRIEPLARSQCAVGGPDLIAFAGLRFRVVMRIQLYNYETHQIEPMDFTDKEVEFKIFQPKYAVEMMLTNEETGEQLVVPFELSSSESMEFDELASDAERQIFLSGLPSAQSRLAQAVAQLKGQEDKG